MMRFGSSSHGRVLVRMFLQQGIEVYNHTKLIDAGITIDH
jgi:hypothetical protein